MEKCSKLLLIRKMKIRNRCTPKQVAVRALQVQSSHSYILPIWIFEEAQRRMKMCVYYLCVSFHTPHLSES